MHYEQPDGSTALPDFLINIIGTNALSDQQINWIENSDNLNSVDKLLYQVTLNGSTNRSKDVAAQLIQGILLNPNLHLDIDASFKSPFNIDKSTITDATTAGAKFNSIYKSLTESPEFKRLFLDIFENNKRDNVKFEIADHVNENNDPQKKEVNATTSYDPVTKNIIIKISKQILIAGNTMSQTKIENAKTILHECIHAYLFIKDNHPATGVDFVKILNSMYPTPNEQHDFMYGKMIPTMQKVLTEIRDSVTTEAGRTVLETEYTMRPTTNPLTSTPWIWNEYYKFISLNGLEEASCFKVDFPKDSDSWKLFVKYLEYGKKELQP